MTTQAIANFAFQDFPKKKPATNVEDKCAREVVKFAVSQSTIKP